MGLKKKGRKGGKTEYNRHRSGRAHFWFLKPDHDLGEKKEKKEGERRRAPGISPAMNPEELEGRLTSPKEEGGEKKGGGKKRNCADLPANPVPVLDPANATKKGGGKGRGGGKKKGIHLDH